MNTDTGTSGVAVVTGGSRGIGAATVSYLAASGMAVACTATDLNRATAVAEAVHAETGATVLPLELRVEDAEGVRIGFEKAQDALGPITLLVNNAGVTNVAPLLEADLDALSHLIDVNVKGVLNCSKAAIHHLTKILAIELAQYKIRVNCVAPGFVETDMVRKLVAEGILDADALKRRTPLHELIPAEEIAGTIAWLASSQAAHVTGESLLVDGGWTAYGHL